MPQWEAIEDASAEAAPVWLHRPHPSAWKDSGGPTEEDHSEATKSPSSAPRWRPLRKTDCQSLNETLSRGGSQNVEVLVDAGRATAKPLQQKVYYNFSKSEPEMLDYATWFIVKPDDKQARDDEDYHPLIPIFHKGDAILIEEYYQDVLRTTSSLGKGLASALERAPVVLHDESKVKLVKSSDGKLALKRTAKSNSWFSGPSQTLQRGYGEYQVVGEDIENQLSPDVQHVVFVVHGIGEALFSRQDITSLPSHREAMEQLRLQLQEKQFQQWQHECTAAKKQKSGVLPPPPGRIELIAIEWFDELHDASSALMKSLRAVTLSTIPSLRAIANDVVFDVLMYLTPAFCQSVLECVTRQICEFYDRFLKVHPTFTANGGKCSLIGHSLGSVIAFDLLCVLKDKERKQGENSPANTSTAKTPSDVGYQAFAGAKNTAHAHGVYGPSVSKPLETCIPFRPEVTIFLGSPVGIFLTLRGAHCAFEELRQQASHGGILPSASPFVLPTESLYNIYHPSDPIAYRIEPLLLSPHLDPEHDLPAPLYLTAPGKQVRLDLKAKQLGDEIRKSLMDQKSSWNTLLSSAVTALAQDVKDTPSTGTGINRVEAAGLKFPLGGRNDRVDYSLQPGVVHNEYISAVTAHSSYFTNTDFQDFMIGLMGGTDGP